MCPQAVLGPDAPQNEAHVIQVETADYDGKDLKVPIVNLHGTRTSMVSHQMSLLTLIHQYFIDSNHEGLPINVNLPCWPAGR